MLFSGAVPVGAAHAERGRRPLANAVDGQDGGVLVRRAEEGARRVGQVVLDKQHLLVWHGKLAADCP